MDNTKRASYSVKFKLSIINFLSPITIAQQLENNISLFRSHLEIQQFQLYSGG